MNAEVDELSHTFEVVLQHWGRHLESLGPEMKNHLKYHALKGPDENP